MKIITYAEIVLSALLIIAILLQQKGMGLSSAIGGGFMEYSTKRGAEKAIFYATIVLAILFFGIAVARLLI
ncbi:MAG: preprotein translocase subunit SecG [Candidatus Yanofskybacteria bacterium RIFCSPHIGHO2_01_FULL_45_42]|uniref:Protein-export membrane protein SecG n=3 Tax=Candidatus Yanofskyibacteriota TaxID=1752733 RepID=A0A1F8H3R3_9BACT|nr:MAG: preprotein translocase subunit SecG [Candidatus Yanofskybacteria bacterium RIFCSPHIGHO2_01_FULL_45_42]OGN15586.1 MAG: preprotein translocase subunit SecG [Candidatus Yanofskybacteria bacterium RIFCSPHIGHO2_02_FULL_46_19]OGN27910.1 MAG: preprotein translocase subunit SecG [Candidatus Yanofskybacteria bacterium RIFCSPLOWO2_01_FULL_45_72]OGN32222.1 MAG: preprotein translocase subunit SecG [Candidatus Yanofskybacteria bacterium RIFCSPLOWO2_02_FULL_45_18]